MRLRIIPVIILLALLAAQARAQTARVASVEPDTAATAYADSEPEYFFYKRYGYGSDHLSSPLRLILNGGYGIVKMEGRSNRFDDIDYRNGWDNVWRNLRHPVKAIEAKGWWEFIKSEVLPVSFNSGDAQYWPNYWNHMLGGGFSYRLMREWYRAHGFEHETSWSMGTMVVYHLLNETVEMDSKTSWRVDPIADVYLFDVAGILLFSSDRVCRFFSHTMNMSDWSFQPFWDPETGRVENIGLNYMMRTRLGRETPWFLFYHWGNGGELGVARNVGDDHFISCGAGWVAKNLEDVDGISETANLARSFGFFYDRGGSLMASVLYSKNLEARWQVNVYPGLVNLGPVKPGLSFIETQSGEVTVGVTFGNAPLLPLGIGGRTRRGG